MPVSPLQAQGHGGARLKEDLMQITHRRKVMSRHLWRNTAAENKTTAAEQGREFIFTYVCGIKDKRVDDLL